MLNISVIIITFNEERNLERCLLSLQGVAEEIIVVDSFSTDRTEEIASRFKVRFVKNKFEGHIQQKNFALGLTQNTYVLSLDADEALSDGLRNELEKIKENCSFDAYYFNRLTRFYNKWVRFGDWYPDRKLRLWNKEKGNWGGINPHDKVIMNPGTTETIIHQDIIHYYYDDVQLHMQQLNYFSGIAALEYFRMGRKTSLFTALVHSVWRFFRAYVLKGGFLDGSVGFIIAAQYSYYTFLKYIRLRQLLTNQINK